VFCGAVLMAKGINTCNFAGIDVQFIILEKDYPDISNFKFHAHNY
jgi:hypothetical protein